MADVIEGATVIGKGYAERSLSRDEIHDIVREAAAELRIAGKRVLTLIPDGTRTMPMPLLFELLQQEIGAQAAACDYLVALGTHPAMSDEQLSSHIGQPVVNGVSGRAKIFNHRWERPETFVEIGVIPADVVNRSLRRPAREWKCRSASTAWCWTTTKS